MGHNITAIIIKGKYDRSKAKEYDLRGVDLGYDLTMFMIDIYYVAYWQHSLELKKHLNISPPPMLLIPTEEVIAHLVKEISSDENIYALICTDYFGGVGGYKYAALLRGLKCIASEIESINDVLKYLGVTSIKNIDEFDSVGLFNYRAIPPYLEKYRDLCDGLGL